LACVCVFAGVYGLCAITREAKLGPGEQNMAFLQAQPPPDRKLQGGTVPAELRLFPPPRDV